jgi:hypothetical protein
MAELKTSLVGRVRNTSLPKSHALLPLTEALVNSIQAVDARFGEDVTGGDIQVRVLRVEQASLQLDTAVTGRLPNEPILGFEVQDNGEGFTDGNMAAFQTLDTDYKADLGCRGVGRLTWLKAFQRIQVSSTYQQDDATRVTRVFRFSESQGVALDEPFADEDDISTTVTLDGFREEYRKNAPKTPDTIAKELFAGCLWYFIRPGGAPRIRLMDGDELIDFQTLFDEYASEPQSRRQLEVKGEKFDLVSMLLKGASDTTPRLYWCAASRVVIEENLTGRIPGLHGRMASDSGELTYVAFLSSDFLDGAVRSDRTAFDIAPTSIGTLDSSEVSVEDIRASVLGVVEEQLAEHLAVSREAGRERIANFVRSTAPRYRPLLKRFEDLSLTVDPRINDRDLELELHRQLQRVETEVIKQGQEVLAQSNDLTTEQFDDQLRQYLSKVEDIKMSDLAGYVARRRTVLEILRKLIQADATGKYSREELVHQLLMPMRTDSDTIPSDASNMWIIDERLAFHEYLGSDKTLKSIPVTGSKSTKEPDVLALQLIDTPVLLAEGQKLPLASIVVIEIKRPMRDDATKDDKNPISQCLDYLERVRKGGVTTTSGRPIPQSEQIPGYCYVVADLTDSMISRCKDANLKPTQDGLGFFGFNDARQAYIEVISFDRLVNAAMERNRAFFDKLGLPSA